MHDVRASVEVRALIGAGHLRQLHENASAQYECWQCGWEGRTTEPTSIIVLAYRIFRVVKLAHAAGADSQIIEVGAAAMRAAAGRPAARRHGQQEAPAATGRPLGYYQVLARWTTPDGRARTGRVPVIADIVTDRTVPMWVDSAGSPTGFPVNHHRLTLARETTAATVAIVALGSVLLCLAWAGRWVLDRRRLAGWEVAWAAVGPEWTKHFRRGASRGNGRTRPVMRGRG